jgi:hypothetical protein
MTGCDGGGSDKPAGFSPEVDKKNRDLINGGYRQQIMEHRAQQKKAAAKPAH